MDLRSWTCLFTGRNIGLVDDEMRNVLMIGACTMHIDQVDRIRVQQDVCIAILQTEWKIYSVGARSGVLFYSNVETNHGSGAVNFLLHDKDLKRGGEIIRAYKDGVRGWTGPSVLTGELPAEVWEERDLRPHKLN
jgi:hypothetical protein